MFGNRIRRREEVIMMFKNQSAGLPFIGSRFGLDMMAGSFCAFPPRQA